jgi:uncharacterized protein (DUF2147 family)
MNKKLIWICTLIWCSKGYCQDKIIGMWLTSDSKSHISIFKTNDHYQGSVSWVKDSIDPNTSSLVKDIHNPDPALRSRNILGLCILNHFKYDSIKKIYQGGSFYFPRNGKAYRGKMWLVDSNTIAMRGYVLMFHSTDLW